MSSQKIKLSNLCHFILEISEILCHHKNKNYQICVITKIKIIKFVSFYIRKTVNFVSSQII